MRVNVAVTVLIAAVVGADARAMPWDVDMWRQESLRTNEVARSPVIGAVPRGSTPFQMTTEEAEKRLANPVQPNRGSIDRGRRLYLANCLTCHGETADGRGPVGPLMQVPDIRTDFYRGYGDGRIYGVLMNGGSNMPRYGYKFSDAERWDLVNYIRFLQQQER